MPGCDGSDNDPPNLDRDRDSVTGIIKKLIAPAWNVISAFELSKKDAATKGYGGVNQAMKKTIDLVDADWPAPCINA